MALSPAGLSNAINEALGITDPRAQAGYLQLATAIITYLVANTVVATSDSGTVIGTAASTPPAPVTGTSTGTGTGTISIYAIDDIYMLGDCSNVLYIQNNEWEKW